MHAGMWGLAVIASWLLYHYLAPRSGPAWPRTNGTTRTHRAGEAGRTQE
jgi:hypothetical protein